MIVRHHPHTSGNNLYDKNYTAPIAISNKISAFCNFYWLGQAGWEPTRLRLGSGRGVAVAIATCRQVVLAQWITP